MFSTYQNRMDAAVAPRANAIGINLNHGIGFAGIGLGSRNMSRDHVSDLVINQTRQRWNAMTVPELLTELESYKLKSSGAKEDLIKTLDHWFHPTYDFDLAELKKNRLRIFCVAEKPQLAKELSRVLATSSPPIPSRFGDVTYWSFSGSYNGIPADFVFTSTFGHVYTLDFVKPSHADGTEKLKPRSSPDDMENLFDETVENRFASEGGEVVFKALQYLAIGSDVLELWLDCDLEGEAICYEVINIVKDVMNQPPTKNIMDVVFRAKFSAAGDAPKAARSMIKPNFRQNLANIAKHEIDLRVGVSFSNMQTTTLRRVLRDRCIPSVTFGPCQSTCLAFAVERDLLQKNYVPRMLHYIVAAFEVDQISFVIKLEKSKKEAKRIEDLLKGRKECLVKSVETANQTKNAPAGLNTFGLLVESSRHLGIGPADAMRHADLLYQRGIISYPRSETTRYEDGIDVMGRIKIIKHDFPDLLIDMEKFEARVRDKGFEVNPGIDVGDHTPIIPALESLDKAGLSPEQWKVYKLVCLHFLASFCDDHLYHTKTVTLDLRAGLTFTHEINVMDNEGYTVFLPEEKVKDEKLEDLPVKQGTIVRINSITVEHELSKPPNTLKESDLIMFMVDNRIGTDGSIPNHIEKLQERGYLKMNEENREVTVTDLGLQLYKVHNHCIPQLIKPGLRSAVEKQVLQIASGEKNYEEVCKPILGRYRNDFKLLCKTFKNLCGPFASCFVTAVHHKYRRQVVTVFSSQYEKLDWSRKNGKCIKVFPYFSRIHDEESHSLEPQTIVDGTSPETHDNSGGNEAYKPTSEVGGCSGFNSVHTRHGFDFVRGSGRYPDFHGVDGASRNGQDNSGGNANRPTNDVSRRGFLNSVHCPPGRGSFSGRGRSGGSYPDPQGVDGVAWKVQDSFGANRLRDDVIRRGGRSVFNSGDRYLGRGSFSGAGWGVDNSCGRGSYLRGSYPNGARGGLSVDIYLGCGRG